MSEPIEGPGIVWAIPEINRRTMEAFERNLRGGETGFDVSDPASKPGNTAQSEATEPPRGRPAEISEREFAAENLEEMPITEPRPVSTSLAVAKRVEASEGPERAGNKPLMRNPNEAPVGDTASDTFSDLDRDGVCRVGPRTSGGTCAGSRKACSDTSATHTGGETQALQSAQFISPADGNTSGLETQAPTFDASIYE